MGVLYWLLLILAIIAAFTGYAVAGVYASVVVFLILFVLLGWKTFGAPLQ